MEDPTKGESTPRPEASEATPLPEASEAEPRHEASEPTREPAGAAQPNPGKFEATSQTPEPNAESEAAAAAGAVQQPPTTAARSRATPQRVLPTAQSTPPRAPNAKKRRKPWLFAAVTTGVIVLAAIVAAGAVAYNDRVANSPQAQVQRAIDTFVAALAEGDLATLRTSTCGSLAEYYQQIPDNEFAEVHRVAVTQENIPVVGDVDAVQITDDTAIAQVEAHTTADPNEQSWRTFNLERVDGSWKICDPL
ncbi:hypothetical protein [Rhodococcus sp. NPDC049939]|uniref:Rv0361 family membrane protein n=1 Tax=Rhodococcus sp. NPDC049939 TaxID=3155511 RepID=UPI0033F2C95D